MEPALLIVWSLVVAVAISQLSFARTGTVELIYFTVPVYGRQLARLLCVVPTALSVTLAIALVIGIAGAGLGVAPGGALPWPWWSPPLAAAAGTLTMQSARLRDRGAGALYRLIAAIVVALVFAMGVESRPALAVACALLCIYLSVRGLAETLARYDPLP